MAALTAFAALLPERNAATGIPMMLRKFRRVDSAENLTFYLLVAFLGILWFAGGASRPDAVGQPVVRLAAWIFLIGYLFIVPRSQLFAARSVGIFLALTVALVAIQLVPLPPNLWAALPGRTLLLEAATLSGQPQPWRPISLSPAATYNALWSLIIPVVIYLYARHLSTDQHGRIVLVLLVLVVVGSILGLLQVSGMSIDHPMVNDIRGLVSGNFANRNHFALFIATGCTLAFAWTFRDREAGWRVAVLVGLILTFGLLLLAIGSRSGIVLGLLGIALGAVSVRTRALQEFRRLPRPVAMSFTVAAVGLIGGAIWLSIFLGRAESLARIGGTGPQDDVRAELLPVVIGMIGKYFPVGSGFGTFDPVFRISEPNSLLNPQYFNHAHNDFLELVLDGGLPAAALLLVALIWVIRRSIRAWKSAISSREMPLPWIGSALLLLVFAASITDYPARTPMIMALIVLAALWLDQPFRQAERPRSTRKGGREL